MGQPHKTRLVLRREALDGVDFEAQARPFLAGLHARHPAFQHHWPRRLTYDRRLHQPGPHRARRKARHDT